MSDQNHLGLVMTQVPQYQPSLKNESPDKKHPENKFNWKWDKQLNRLCSERKKPIAGDFHKDTLKVVDNRELLKRTRNDELGIAEIKIPKSVRNINKIEKLDLINKEIKRIEQ